MDGVSANDMATVKSEESMADHSDSGGCHRKVSYGPDCASARTTFPHRVHWLVSQCQIPSADQLCRHLLAVFREGRGGYEDDLAS